MDRIRILTNQDLQGVLKLYEEAGSNTCFEVFKSVLEYALNHGTVAGCYEDNNPVKKLQAALISFDYTHMYQYQTRLLNYFFTGRQGYSGLPDYEAHQYLQSVDGKTVEFIYDVLISNRVTTGYGTAFLNDYLQNLASKNRVWAGIMSNINFKDVLSNLGYEIQELEGNKYFYHN